MASIKGTFGSCWRRKTLTCRIFSTLVQLIIIIAVWEAVKSIVPYGGHGNVHANSERFVNPITCPTTEISHAKVVSLLDLQSIVSQSQVPTLDRQQAFHLKTNIYVRDQKYGSLILYPAGALIDFGDIKEKYKEEDEQHGTKDQVNDFKVDFDDKNSWADFSSRKDESSFKEKEVYNEVPVDYQHGRYKLEMQNKGVADSSKGELHGVRDEAERFRSEMGHEYDRGAGVRNSEHVIDAQNQQDLDHRNTGSLNRKFSDPVQRSDTVKMAINKSPSDPLQYLMKMNQNLAKGLASNDVSQVKEGGRLGGQRINAPPNVLPDYNNNAGYQNPSSQSVADSKVLMQGILIDETGDRLYAEGFLDRVSKVSVEIFGKVVQINPANRPVNFLINNPNLCLGSKNIDVVFLINTVPEHDNLRRRIRETFINPMFFQDFRIVHLFLVGRTLSPNIQQGLNQEQGTYHDIIQGDFYDSPQNATMKGLMGMRWIQQFCYAAKYIMKINDDVFVDTDKLIRGLIPAARRITSKRVMVCYFNQESDLPRTGPGAISPELFPGRSRLRPYCKGFAILITRGVVPSLIAASEYVPSIHLDELYLYGILPYVSGCVEVYDVGNNRAFHNYGAEMLTCYKELEDKCTLVASIADNERFRNLWEYVKERIQMPHQGWENERSLWSIQNYKRRL